ncbi:MAG: Mrp/NBP35 family ATP-binding protein [Saprospiraceae bacterium]|nr:Mrp/NBP35 family ATP-binding protein [Candidatus Brachybacter algidus]
MEIDINEIRQVLSNIKDPKTGQDIVKAGLVKDLFLEGTELNLMIFSNNLDSTDKGNLHQAIVFGIQAEYPELNINLHMVTKADQIDEKASPLPQIQNIIAVASGKGGVGKSTVSVNLAFALNRMGYKVGILDADVYGPSIPTMLGIKGQRPQITNLYGKPKLVPIEVNGVQTISIGLIVEEEQAVVLRGPRLAGIIKQFIEDTVWDALDFLIVDLPPGTGDVQLTLVQSVPLSGAIIVTTPQEVAVVDAVRALNMFRMEQINVNVLGVVENMSWFTPEELPDSRYYIFGEGGGHRLAQMSGSIVLGQIPITMGLREAGDAGTLYAAGSGEKDQKVFEDIGKNLILQLNKILSSLGKSKIVEVKS